MDLVHDLISLLCRLPVTTSSRGFVMVRFLAHDCTDDLAGNFNSVLLEIRPAWIIASATSTVWQARPKPSSQRFRRNWSKAFPRIFRVPCFPNLFRTLSGNAPCALERYANCGSCNCSSHLLCRHPNAAIVPCSRVRSCPSINPRAVPVANVSF